MSVTINIVVRQNMYVLHDIPVMSIEVILVNIEVMSMSNEVMFVTTQPSG